MIEPFTVSNVPVPDLSEIQAAIERVTRIPAWQLGGEGEVQATATRAWYLGARPFRTWLLSRAQELEATLYRHTLAYVFHCSQWPYPRYGVKGRRAWRKRRRERRLWRSALMRHLQDQTP